MLLKSQNMVIQNQTQVIQENKGICTRSHTLIIFGHKDIITNHYQETGGYSLVRSAVTFQEIVSKYLKQNTLKKITRCKRSR